MRTRSIRRVRRIALLSSIVLVTTGGCAGYPARGPGVPDLVIANGQIVDVHTRRITRGHIAITGRRISYVGTAPVTNGKQVLDAEGKWIVPGFVDSHAHSAANIAPAKASARPIVEFFGTEAGARRMLYAGVTAFVDLFGLEDSLFVLRDQQRAGLWRGAELFAAGPCLTAPKGHCTEYGIPTRTIESPAQARSVVANLASKRPDVIKIVFDNSGYLPTIDSATLDAAILAARLAGIPTVVHVSGNRDLPPVVAASASAVTHLPRREVIPQVLAAEMARRRMFYIPTLVTPLDAVFLARDPLARSDSLLLAITGRRLVDAYADTAAFPSYLKGILATSDSTISHYAQSIRLLRDAGVRILVGTDAGNYGSFLGWSVHREMSRLVDAGLNPWEALAAATITPGEFLGRKWGTRVGDEGNLVILDASPVADIGNTRRINAVIHHGRLVDRAALLRPPSR